MDACDGHDDGSTAIRIQNINSSSKLQKKKKILLWGCSGSLCWCFIWSIRASAPKNSLWQMGQEVAFGPPISAACCCRTPRCNWSSCKQKSVKPLIHYILSSSLPLRYVSLSLTPWRSLCRICCNGTVDFWRVPPERRDCVSVAADWTAEWMRDRIRGGGICRGVHLK